MSFADRAEVGEEHGMSGSMRLAGRARSGSLGVSDELRGEVTANLHARGGVTPEHPHFYPVAFERLLAIAGERIAASEAEVDRLTRRCAYLEARLLQRSDPASRSAAAHQDADFPPDAPRVKRDASIAPRLVGSDKNAHSHHERGKR